MAEADTRREQALKTVNWRKLAREVNPLRAAWRLLSSARWAIALTLFLAAVSLLGVLLPQMPAGVRGDPLAEARWLALQEGKFGIFTHPMQRLGLFDIFHARWFAVSLGLLVISLIVYILSRLPSTWRALAHPRKRVPDSYFQGARQRLSFSTPTDAAALERVLRRHRYTVERFPEGEITYLFAERFRWAQVGSLLSHVAIVLFIAAAVVSRLSGFEASLFLAEGASAPVFPALSNPNQMQVHLLDAVGQFDEEGQPLDYRSEVAIFQGGHEVKRCLVTVNSPCQYRGYRLHQAAYFGFGAEVEVRDLTTGNVIYRETLALDDALPAPHVVIRDSAGEVLFDKTVVPTDFVETARGTIITLPQDGRSLWIGVRPSPSGEQWTLVVFEAAQQGQGIRLLIPAGGRAEADGLQFQFADIAGLPSRFEEGFPLPPGLVPDTNSGLVLLEMSNVVYGTAQASEGGRVEVPKRQGPPTLFIIGLQPAAVSLAPGQSATIGNYQYTFLGQREFSGILVKKDESDTLIWVAAALLLGGLVITFWVPRRRLWAKITPTRTHLAGQAGQLVNLRQEMRRLAAEAGAPDLKDDQQSEEEGEDAD